MFANESQAHGDDFNKSKPVNSSSSNEFSFDIHRPTVDTSNEALKTDDENGMTRKEIFRSDLSLRQTSSNEHYEYEIDLGNGHLTKSISSYHKKQRSTSILSADSLQPISTFNIPFSSTIYAPQLNPIEQTRNDLVVESNRKSSSWKIKLLFAVEIFLLILILLFVILIFII